MKRLIESDAGSSSMVAVPIYLLLSAPFLFTRIEVAAEPLHEAACLHTTSSTTSSNHHRFWIKQINWVRPSLAAASSCPLKKKCLRATVFPSVAAALFL